jgi:hypothetical protein
MVTKETKLVISNWGRSALRRYPLVENFLEAKDSEHNHDLMHSKFS